MNGRTEARKQRYSQIFKEETLNLLAVKLGAGASALEAKRAVCVERHISRRVLEKFIAAPVKRAFAMQKRAEAIERIAEAKGWRERHLEEAANLETLSLVGLRKAVEAIPEGEELGHVRELAVAGKRAEGVLVGLGQYRGDQVSTTVTNILNLVQNLPADFKARHFGDTRPEGAGRVLSAAAEGEDGPAVPGK